MAGCYFRLGCFACCLGRGNVSSLASTSKTRCILSVSFIDWIYWIHNGTRGYPWNYMDLFKNTNRERGLALS